MKHQLWISFPWQIYYIDRKKKQQWRKIKQQQPFASVLYGTHFISRLSQGRIEATKSESSVVKIVTRCGAAKWAGTYLSWSGNSSVIHWPEPSMNLNGGRNNKSSKRVSIFILNLSFGLFRFVFVFAFILFYLPFFFSGYEFVIPENSWHVLVCRRLLTVQLNWSLTLTPLVALRVTHIVMQCVWSLRITTSRFSWVRPAPSLPNGTQVHTKHGLDIICRYWMNRYLYPWLCFNVKCWNIKWEGWLNKLFALEGEVYGQKWE